MTAPADDFATGHLVVGEVVDEVVDDAVLDHLQRLARLSVPEDEREAVKRDLGKVLAFVAQLREVDVDGVEELTRPVTPTGAAREDVLAPSLPRELALAIAPATRDGFFEVPRTVEEG
ncbi:MAG TPA: Asp-tRNA(Asn)/Glu-tRNA(Gln) amidotransferase subunit GatC [Trueperaceae bacterium]|nr:Asp-tRNA(Asn)/Glu-tRNA(Gln) amidotransferase subunit GatC [Trueperaceae bacterium]